MRKTLSLTILFALCAAALGWWELQDLWARRHQLLADAIHEKLHTIAPGWVVEFESAELLPGAKIRLTNVHIGPREAGSAIASVEQATLHLDESLFRDQLNVLITRVELKHPVLLLERDSQKRWNWQQLPPIQQGDRPTPNVEIQAGEIRIALAETDSLPEVDFVLGEIDGLLSLTAYRQYRFQGSTRAGQAGTLKFHGLTDLTTGHWELNGSCISLESPNQLLGLAAGLSDHVRQQLETLVARTKQAESHAETTTPAPLAEQLPFRLASRQSRANNQAATPQDSQSTSSTRCEIPLLGIAVDLQLGFQLQGNFINEAENLQYQVAAHVQNGVIENPSLTIPLYNLQGDFLLDNTQLVIHQLQASNGESRFFLDGRIIHGVEERREFLIRAANLTFGRDIRKHLWGGLRRLYDSFSPAGRFNIDIALATSGKGNWDITLREFSAYECSVIPKAFPYPIRQASGSIRQQGEDFLVSFTGMAGSEPITVKGSFRNTGPDLQGEFQVDADNIPIDGQLLTALQLSGNQAAHDALRSLQMSGVVDADLTLVKRGRIDPRFQTQLDVQLRQGSITPRVFPLPLTRLTGRVRYNPLAEDPRERGTWYFENLSAVHGQALFHGTGTLSKRQGLPVLDILISANNVPISQALAHACTTANPALEDLSRSLFHEGAIDVKDARIIWSPGTKPSIAMPSIVVRDARIRPVYLPYTWERLMATVRWEHGRLIINSITGWHGTETYLQIGNGGDAESAIVEFPDQGEVAWHLHLHDIRLRKLDPDQEVRQALPVGIASVVDAINPRGRIDLNLRLDLKGFRSHPETVTAAYELQVRLPKNDLTVGVDLSNVTGWIDIPYGTWDGRTATAEGFFELEQATILGMPCQEIQGPFRIEGNHVFFGTPPVDPFGRSPRYISEKTKYQGKPIQARLYKGTLKVEGLAVMDDRDPEQTEYRIQAGITNARLEEWARDAGLVGERLRGPVTAGLDIRGRGSSDRTILGDGYIQILNAELYELPVLNSVLARLELRQPSVTAFNYADGRFTVHDGLFDFFLIDLLGESLRLVGKGTVAFGKGMNQQIAIDFYRSQFRNRVPIIGPAFSLLTQNSVGVKVRGTLSQPVTEVQPKLGVIDDTLRKMLESFDAGQIPMRPRPIQGLPRRIVNPRPRPNPR